MTSLLQYQVAFEKKLPLLIEEMGEKTVLREACAYALGGGKRLRPSLVLMIADSLGRGADVFHAAFSVECFHAASLIADDFPCMDNDSFRRGRPSLHKAFGESSALLASYTLIATGYGAIAKNSAEMKRSPFFQEEADHRAVLSLEAATRCAGLQGATQGQYLDLFPPDSSLETIREVIYKKTVTLFEISFLFGWIFGGGALSSLSLLTSCAGHLGMAFQIADDLDDVLQDKSEKSPINIAAALGKEKALFLFDEESAAFKKGLQSLGLWTRPFEEVFDRMIHSFSRL